MRVNVALLLCLGPTACSFQARVAGTDATSIDGPTSKSDAASNGDAGGDAMTGDCLVAGARTCIDATTAGYCDSSLQAVADRPCPPTSTCVAGHCAPPAGATACQRASDCTIGVCDLYVVMGMLVGRCTPAQGSGGMFSDCGATGNAGACETGICAADSGGESQQCLVPCRPGMNGDCPGGECLPIGEPTTIEGAPVGGSACFQSS